MAAKDKMCSYSSITGHLPEGIRWYRNYVGPEVLSFFNGKNKRVTCPECGRKMWAARRTCHDGCCPLYCVPPHKKKGWWKIGKKKKQSRDGSGRRLR